MSLTLKRELSLYCSLFFKRNERETDTVMVGKPLIMRMVLVFQGNQQHTNEKLVSMVKTPASTINCLSCSQHMTV